MKSLSITIALLFISIISFGQNQKYSKLDSYFSSLEENDRFFGSVAVYKAGEVIYSNAIGSADINTNTDNTIETKFRIGSISKTFTATLMMKAVELEKINLDDTINTYLPNIQNADKITVKQLLKHRSGLQDLTDRDYFNWNTQSITRSALLDSITVRGISFEPDSKYEYCNSNYILLTYILEDVYGQPYEDILNQNIVEPLSLVNTSYGGVINTVNNEAKSFDLDDVWEEVSESDMSVPLGAGGIISTPTDLCLFAKALFSGQLISESSLKQMEPVEGEEYGFALYGMELANMNGIGHGGSIDAFESTLTYFEEEDIVFALSCNGVAYSRHAITVAVLSEVTGQPYDMPIFKSVELASNELDKYVGIYETDALPLDLMFTQEDGALYLQATGQSINPLVAEGNHVFSYSKLGVRIEFMIEEKMINFKQGGAEFDFTLKEKIETEEVGTSIVQDLSQYLGTYESDALPIDLSIIEKNGKLIGQGTGQPSFSLQAVGTDTYTNDEIGLKITFSPAESKMNFQQGVAGFIMTLKPTVDTVNEEVVTTELDQYTGTYASDALPMDLVISKKDGELIGQGTGQASFPLAAEGLHTFINKEIGLTITFSPEESKMNFEQGGAGFEMIMEK